LAGEERSQEGESHDKTGQQEFFHERSHFRSEVSVLTLHYYTALSLPGLRGFKQVFSKCYN